MQDLSCTSQLCGLILSACWGLDWGGKTWKETDGWNTATLWFLRKCDFSVATSEKQSIPGTFVA